MKRRYIVIGGIVLAVLIFLGVLFLPRMGQFRAASALTETRASVVQAAEQGGQTSGEGYVSPVDFKTLQAGNSDIYGWLYIPGTEINEPLLQRDGDNQYYLSHNSLGMEDEVGALFTESEYNAKDFNDIATVIYGKNTLMLGGKEHIVRYSQAYIEGEELVVTSGAMKKCRGRIKKILRHKRLVVMEIPLMGRMMEVTVGMGIVSRQGDYENVRMADN